MFFSLGAPSVVVALVYVPCPFSRAFALRCPLTVACRRCGSHACFVAVVVVLAVRVCVRVCRRPVVGDGYGGGLRPWYGAETGGTAGLGLSPCKPC